MASDPAPSSIGNLPGFKFDMGHQEAERIVDELEQICRTVRNSAGDAWMLVASAQNMICTDLGYEDEGELEVRSTAALLIHLSFGPEDKPGSFAQMPQCEGGLSVDFSHCFRVRVFVCCE